MAIEVSTPQELSNIRNDLTADYVLTSDIDLVDFGEFVPIAAGYNWNSTADEFTGSLDGQGHVIKNLKVRGLDASNHYGIGFLGIATNVNIKNITFENADVQLDIDGYGVGILGYDIEESLVENCHVRNSLVRGLEYTGGLIGMTYGTTEVIGCSVEDTVIEFNTSLDEALDVGGLIGSGGVNKVSESYVKNITMRFIDGIDGAIDKKILFGGGFVGYAGGNFDNCLAEDVSLENVDFLENVGGFIGNNGTDDIYRRCAAKDFDFTVNTPASNYMVGGFLPYGDCTIKNSYARGTIQLGGNNIGGFAATLKSGAETINCYSAVDLTGVSADTTQDGAFTGTYDTRDALDIYHEKCYYDNDLVPAGLNSYGSGDEVYITNPPEARTTAEMTFEYDDTTYIDWDFRNIWFINEFTVYPVIFKEIEFGPKLIVKESKDLGVLIDELEEMVEMEITNNHFFPSVKTVVDFVNVHPDDTIEVSDRLPFLPMPKPFEFPLEIQEKRKIYVKITPRNEYGGRDIKVKVDARFVDLENTTAGPEDYMEPSWIKNDPIKTTEIISAGTIGTEVTTEITSGSTLGEVTTEITSGSTLGEVTTEILSTTTN